MVLVLFGDTHELHREVEVPAGDILICVGDFTMFSRNLSAIEDFNEWLGELPHRHKVVVPGNHEFFLESNPEHRSLLDNANVLIDESMEIEGLTIYASPMTPLCGAAFGKSSPKDRERPWSTVPVIPIYIASVSRPRTGSNDPVCSQHLPESPHARSFLLGAACHGCLLVAETSCEQQNDLLDRSLVVRTVQGTNSEFFGELMI